MYRYCSNLGHFAFLGPFGGLETTYDSYVVSNPPKGYDVHLGLIRKRVLDFLLVIIELFCYGVTAEVLRAKIDRKSAISLQRGHFDSQ